MTNQEIFDKVARHLLTQNAQSLWPEPYGGCAYRGRDGTKCAVGCLIPDSLYSPELEGLAVYDDSGVMDEPILCVLKDLGIQEYQFGLLSDLQNLHDTNLPQFWPAILSNIAKRFDVDDSVLDEFPNSIADV